MDQQQILDLAAFEPQDRPEAQALLDGAPVGAESSWSAADVEPSLVVEALLTLRSRLGEFGADWLRKPDYLGKHPGLSERQAELVWLKVYLIFLPEYVNWAVARGIPQRIIAETCADIGRHVAISRRVWGMFGLETWGWLSLHLNGYLYQLGRPQFHLRLPPADLPLSTGQVLDIHIPESGSMRPELVEESLQFAAGFFRQHFPEHPVTLGVCESWLLDPALSRYLPKTSNIVRFAARFTPYAAVQEVPSDALYFVFRTRNYENLERLPKETSVQRAVLQRIEDGEQWGVGKGYLHLPAITETRP